MVVFCAALCACIRADAVEAKAPERSLQNIVCDIYNELIVSRTTHIIIFNNLQHLRASIGSRSRRPLANAEIVKQKMILLGLMSEIETALTILINNPTNISYKHCVGEKI